MSRTKKKRSAIGKRKVLLSRPMSDRLTRFAAGVLLLLPIGRSARGEDLAKDDASSHEPDHAQFPEAGSAATQQNQADAEIITGEVIQRWRWRTLHAPPGLKTNQQFLQDPASVKALPEEFREALFAELASKETPMADLILKAIRADFEGNDPNVTVEEISQALAYREGTLSYEHWWNAWLWRMTRYVSNPQDSEALRTLFARLEKNAQVTDALIRATFEVKPTRLNPRAWMSKAGPPRELRMAENATLAALLAAAQNAYAAETPTTWRRDAVVRLKLTNNSGSAVLWRRGEAIQLEPGDTFSFGRLDILQAKEDGDVRIRDVKFGVLRLSANTQATVWQLPDLLRAGRKANLQALVTAALQGDDENEARELEIALPLSHAAIREALAKQPDAPGAARLRMIMTLFDDTLFDDSLPQINDGEQRDAGVATNENPQRRATMPQRGDDLISRSRR